jgi:flagellar biosynthetic protein FliR
MSISYHKVLFAALLIKEIIIGFIIGFLAQLPFYAFSSLGYFIDIFRGANLIEMLDPYFKQEVSLLGEFYFQLSIIIFLMIDGHHIFLSALANSYVLMPIDSFSLCICSNKLFIDQLIKATYSVIRISLQLGAPFMIVGFMMEILISLLNKISPYFNAFFYGMALKTSVGLLICIMTYYFLQHRIAIEFANALKFLDWLGR